LHRGWARGAAIAADIHEIDVVALASDVIRPRTAGQIDIEACFGGIGRPVHEEHDALGRETLAAFETFVSHMQLNARIDRRDHECLGDDSLRVRRRGYEPGDQQGGHNSKMAQGFPLEAVIVVAWAIGICRRARATLATPSLLRRGGRSISSMHYNSCLADVMGFSDPARRLC